MRITIEMDNTFTGQIEFDEFMLDCVPNPTQFVLTQITNDLDLCIRSRHLEAPSVDA